MILALDLGSKLGVAWGEPGDTPQTDMFQLSTDMNKHFGEFRMTVNKLLNRYEPECVFWERPFLSRKVHEKTIQILYGQYAIMMLLCGERENIIHKQQWMPQQARRMVMQRAQKVSKQQIISWCLGHGINVTSDHAADAALIWVVALRQEYSEYLAGRYGFLT